MPTPNKYHGSGRLYTAEEYRDRKHYLRPTYVTTGYKVPRNKSLPQALQGPIIQPRDKGNNGRKRLARRLGYKSLKQWVRHSDD